MKQSFVKLASWLLAIAMLVSMPVSAFAEESCKHELVEVAAKAATCIEAGNILYYHCQKCGKNFSDEGATKEIGDGDIVIPKNESVHKIEKVAATASTCKEQGTVEHYRCTLCEKLFSDAEGKTAIADKNKVLKPLDYKTHKLVEVKKAAATGTSIGYKRDAFYCSVCDMYFASKGDAESGTSLLKSEVVEDKIVCATHEMVATAKVEPTYTSEGKQAFWTCKNCGKVFKDVDGKTEVTNTADLIIPKLTRTVKTGVVNSSSNLKVRKGAGVGFGIVKSLPTGTNVTIYETAKASNGVEWGKISETEDQWVCLQYITLDKTTETKPEETKPSGTTSEGIATGVVNSSSNLKVRNGAGMNFAIVTSLPTGTKVTIYEKKAASNGVMWGRVDAKEQKWVCLSYVTITSETKNDSGSGSGSNETIVNDKVLGTGVVSSSIELNVRNGAGVGNALVKKLTSGTKVKIYETKQVGGATWGRIHQSESQWVCLQYVKLDGTISGGDTKGTNGVVANCSSHVNVRSAAGVNNKLVGTLAVGTRVTVTEQTKVNGVSWGHVEKGWVCMDYIKLDSNNSNTGNNSGSTTLLTMNIPAYVSKNNLPVYDKIGGSTVLLELISNTEITVTEQAVSGDNVYGKITIGNVTGWINMNGVIFRVVDGTVSSAQLTVYSDADTSSKVLTVLGKGAVVTIRNQKVSGNYVWGKIQYNGNDGWVQLSNVTLNISKNNDASETAKLSMTGKVKVDMMTLYKEAGSATELIKLGKNTSVTILDWKYEAGETWGKMTFGPYTGWVKLSDITQNTVNGTVKNAATKTYNGVAGSEKKLTLPKGNAVIIVERQLASDNKTVWGQIIVSGEKYWLNVSSDVTLGSSNTSSGTTAGTTTGTTTGGTTAGGTTTGGTATGTTTSSVKGTIANTDKVNVRKAAGVNNPVVTTLTRGTVVTVYEQTTVNNAAWGRIDQGWVALNYVNLSTNGNTSTSIGGGTTTGTTSILTTVPSGALAVGFVDTPELAVRASASQGANKVGSLKRGTNVVIKEQVFANGMVWGRIDQGWICTSYVTYTGIGSTGTGTSGLIARCYYTARIRSNAGVGNAVMGNVMVNSKVEIYETKTYSGEQWGRTSLGWISMNYVMTGTVPTP